MTKKKSKPQKRTPKRFANDEEIRILAMAVRKHMGEPYVSLTAERAGELEDIIRFSPITQRFKEEREERGLSIKEVANQLKVPQYRLRDIESARYNIKPEFLNKYATFLELGPWLRRWVKANRELAERMGISDRRLPHADTQADRRWSAHRFKIQLKEIHPLIWRRIEAPSNYSFWARHVAIQDAMGWLDYHLHMFRIIEPESGERHRSALRLTKDGPRSTSSPDGRLSHPMPLVTTSYRFP
jgi:transcriptional regulator with XRE-family HTH domain